MSGNIGDQPALLRKGSKMHQLPQVFGVAGAIVLAAAHNASAFNASFSWSGISACGKASPAFTIHDAPNGTESLRFMMSDKDAPRFRHGGSTVRYDGSGHVPEGAIIIITSGLARPQVPFTAMFGGSRPWTRAARSSGGLPQRAGSRYIECGHSIMLPTPRCNKLSLHQAHVA
jgi:hypothetical protein